MKRGSEGDRRSPTRSTRLNWIARGQFERQSSTGLPRAQFDRQSPTGAPELNWIARAQLGRQGPIGSPGLNWIARSQLDGQSSTGSPGLGRPGGKSGGGIEVQVLRRSRKLVLSSQPGFWFCFEVWGWSRNSQERSGRSAKLSSRPEIGRCSRGPRRDRTAEGLLSGVTGVFLKPAIAASECVLSLLAAVRLEIRLASTEKMSGGG